jgi:hypothetical protein
LSRFGLNVYDKGALDTALGGYTFFNPAALGEDVFSNRFRELGTDVGDGALALKKSDVDYYKKLADAVGASGLSGYGVKSLAPQLSELYNFEASKYGIPVARFGTTEGAQDMRYIPHELVTELRKSSGGNALTGIREFVGNDKLFDIGQLTLLPEQYVPQLAKTDWYGTDLSTLNNPGLGYMLTASQLASIYGGGDYTGAPEGALYVNNPVLQTTNGGAPYRPFSNETPSMAGKLPWMENQGVVTSMADTAIHKMTPEIQAIIDQKITDYQLAQQNFLGNGMYAGLTENYLTPYRNAEWFIADPNNSANIMLGQLANGVTDWTQLGPSLTDAGREHLYGTIRAVQQNNAAEAKGDLFSTIVSGIISAGMGGALGPLMGATGAGAVSGGVMSAINGGDILQGALSGGITGAMGGTGDAFAATDAARLAQQGIGLDQIASTLSQTYGMSSPAAYLTALSGMGADLTGLSPGAVQGGVSGAAGAALRGQSLEEILGAGLGGGLTGGLADADIGGSNSLFDRYAPQVAGSLAKDALLTGGENTDKILLGALTNAMGSEASSVVRSALRPSDETLSEWNEDEETKWMGDAAKWGGDLVASLVRAGVSRAAAEAFADDEIAQQRELVRTTGTQKTTARASERAATAARERAAAQVAKRRKNAMQRMLAQSSKGLLDEGAISEAMQEEEDVLAMPRIRGEIDPELAAALEELESMGVQYAEA